MDGVGSMTVYKRFYLNDGREFEVKFEGNYITIDVCFEDELPEATEIIEEYITETYGETWKYLITNTSQKLTH